MKTKFDKNSIEYYSKLKYVGETWREARDRIVKKRRDYKVKGLAIIK